ncbi:hypothetical protein ACU5JM_00755 (plasmid) [Rhodococcus erythropolis]|uniref:hypothetical protein n=1 Tax=Rhodococcus erythropolis TaxID=1833 RepID=UPI00406BC235
MTTTEHSHPPAATSHHTLPGPSEQAPTLSRPIIGIFTGALAIFGIPTWAAVTDSLPALATIAASGAAIFVLFTVLHDTSHYSISSNRWGQRLLGARSSVLRFAADFVQVFRVHPYRAPPQHQRR